MWFVYEVCWNCVVMLDFKVGLSTCFTMFVVSRFVSWSLVVGLICVGF